MATFYAQITTIDVPGGPPSWDTFPKPMPPGYGPGVPSHPIYYPPGPVDPGYGVDAGLRPTHPIVIPPDSIGPGVPTHPIYLPVYPSHPIVIPPGSLAPGKPTHPIYLPVYPSHPIVIPPDAVEPGLPEHPIVLPPSPPLVIWGGPYYPTHPIVIPPEAILPEPGDPTKAHMVVYYNTPQGPQRITFTVDLPEPATPTEPTPKG